MDNIIKKHISLTDYNFMKVEEALENMAKEGLILQRAGAFNWIFKEKEPKNIKYAIVYNSSLFLSPEDKGESLISDYAKENGWRFVDNSGYYCVFSNEKENPKSFFETETAKLQNIKSYFIKSKHITNVIIFLLFLYSAYIDANLFKDNIIFDLAKTSTVVLCILRILVLIYIPLNIISDFLWYRRFKNSILNKNKLIIKKRYILKIFDVLIIITVLIALLFSFLVRDKPPKSHRTITYENQEYAILNEDIPLTCEDLYGEIDFKDYSYMKSINSSIFLTWKIYAQQPIPFIKNYPTIDYEIIKPKHQFVYDLLIEASKDPNQYPARSCTAERIAIPNNTFNTVEAFRYSTGKDIFKYVLIYKDTIVTIDTKLLNDEQVATVIEKLNL